MPDLSKLIRQIKGMGSPSFLSKLTHRLEATSLKLVADEFRNETDPYGEKWEPLKHRDGKILQDTGRLRASFSGQDSGSSFKIISNVKYAAVHQYGATIKEHARKAQTLIFNKKGRFISKSKAEKSKGKKIRVSFVKERTQAEYKIPQRMIVPTEDRGLSKTWKQAYNDTAKRFFLDWFKR